MRVGGFVAGFLGKPEDPPLPVTEFRGAGRIGASRDKICNASGLSADIASAPTRLSKCMDANDFIL
jgi:hypothetical protein